VRLRILPLTVLLPLALVACSDDTAPTASSDPMNAVVELDRPIDLGYERTGWDPEAEATAMALAARVTGTSVGCDDPGPVSFEAVKENYERVKLPMPAVILTCASIPFDEDLEFAGFTSEQAKKDYIDAKAELICGRAMAPEADPAVTTRFDGIVYVDAGEVIIEPDSYVVRDKLADELGATGSKMCPDATGDRTPTSASP
jgi:hypothetical protein